MGRLTVSQNSVSLALAVLIIPLLPLITGLAAEKGTGFLGTTLLFCGIVVGVVNTILRFNDEDDWGAMASLLGAILYAAVFWWLGPLLRTI